MKKEPTFELMSDGTIQKVGPFGAFGPTVKAATKSEASVKFLEYAYRSLQNAPTVKVRNGAYQLVTENLDGTVTVQAGTDNWRGCCIEGKNTREDVTDDTASFAYYASAEYREGKAA